MGWLGGMALGVTGSNNPVIVDKSIAMLMELIKFDMQQIQNYREAIIQIATFILIGSFGLSAYIYRKDLDLSKTVKITSSVASTLLLLGTFLYIHYQYDLGLNASRVALELREGALQFVMLNQVPPSFNQLYPDTTGIVPHLPCFLEKLPFYLIEILLMIKIVIELCFFLFHRRRHWQQTN